ncbi:MAG TPA: hypothetical protein VGO11_11175 [Chthoniobacteraceae bacterium]|nr:hypothetical protein [Chthoniobacteraceae bacterium]
MSSPRSGVAESGLDKGTAFKAARDGVQVGLTDTKNKVTVVVT